MSRRPRESAFARHSFQGGFGLVESIVSIGLMLVVFISLFGMLRASLTLSAFVKAQATATELANTQVEYLRGISYDSLGTLGGIPAGLVPQYATSTVDGVPYLVHTYVEYYDDPADGIGISDTNHITTDYKKGKVTVSYSINGLPKNVILFSNFVPPGIETATNGGALSLHVVDATGADLSNAIVQIVNTATSPSINFSTFTDSGGLVTTDGAATSSQYQIYVSRTGYSSAQTYVRDGTNANPTPGYLTVVKNTTTSATFAIDRLATLILKSFSPATTKIFSDSFTSSGNIAHQTNTAIGGGAITLASEMLAGNALSLPITPSNLYGWGVLDATIATTTGTIAVVHVADASGVRVPDSILAGNSAGFSSFPIFLTNIATSSYPSLSLEADLTSISTTTTPSLSAWSLSYTEGLVSLPNVAFTLTGTKTIGTTIANVPIYKTVVTDTTGAAGQKSESLEWDAYSLALSSLPLIESCGASPYQLPPGVSTTTTLIAGATTNNTLPVLVEDALGNTIGNAKVILTGTEYAATIPTSLCGLAYFNNLTAGTYTATVSAPGYTTTATSVTVSGHTATKTIPLP